MSEETKIWQRHAQRDKTIIEAQVHMELHPAYKGYRTFSYLTGKIIRCLFCIRSDW